MEEEHGESFESAREEILRRSRKENKNGDERYAKASDTAIRVAYCAGLFVICIVTILDLVLADRVAYEAMMIMAAMNAGNMIYMGLKAEKSKIKIIQLTAGIMSGIASVALLVLWALELAGIAI